MQQQTASMSSRKQLWILFTNSEDRAAFPCRLLNVLSWGGAATAVWCTTGAYYLFLRLQQGKHSTSHMYGARLIIEKELFSAEEYGSASNKGRCT
jgi:hypothetical protein